MLASGTISEIALIFVTNDDFDTQLNKSLALVGSKLGVSRSYLFIDSPDGTTMSNTHEWCAEGVASHKQNWQDIPYAAIPAFKEILQNEVVHAVEDVDTLPADIRAMLHDGGLRSVLLAPLRFESRVHGFLGFDECVRARVWNKNEVETLKTIAGIISAAYFRKLLAARLSASEANFRAFFDTVDDIIVIADFQGKILFANDGACRRLGYSLDELRGMAILDLHPEEKREEAQEILSAMLRKERTLCPIEIRTKSGARLPVETRIWFGHWDGQDCIFGLSKDLSSEQAALQRFQRLFHNNPTVMAVSSIETRLFVDINDAFVEKSGYSREEVIGRSGQALGLFVDLERWDSVRKELSEKGTVRDREMDIRRKDGKLLHGLLSGDTLDIQGEKFFLTVMMDITEQVELRAELKEEHHRLMNIIESTRLGTWEWDIGSGRTVFNDRWAEMLGYTLAELEPTNFDTWERFTHPDDIVETERRLALHLERKTDYFECECRMRCKDGKWIWILDRGKVIERDDAGRPLKMYGTHSDITEKKVMEEKIHELAIRDPLTGIYNRRYIFERLDEIVAEYGRRGRNFCISLIDLDNFKTVNDTHGHQAGDFVLKEFSGALSSSVRQYDLLGRYGGEEFIIISPSAGAQETCAVIERIMVLVRGKKFVFNEKNIRFTFSCGIVDSAEFSAETLSVEALIALADLRLYEAKKAGRDRFVGPK